MTPTDSAKPLNEARDTVSAAILGFVAGHKSAVGRMMAGIFEIRTMSEAEKLSSMLAMHYPSPEKAATGIWELLSNAIEHGNLEIDHEEKARLLHRGQFDDEIAHRLSLVEFSSRVARVEFERRKEAIHLRVTDEGAGFDFMRYLSDDVPGVKPNGRGIFIARRMCFDRLTYWGRGNVVEAAIGI